MDLVEIGQVDRGSTVNPRYLRALGPLIDRIVNSVSTWPASPPSGSKISTPINNYSAQNKTSLHKRRLLTMALALARPPPTPARRAAYMAVLPGIGPTVEMACKRISPRRPVPRAFQLPWFGAAYSGPGRIAGDAGPDCRFRLDAPLSRRCC